MTATEEPPEAEMEWYRPSRTLETFHQSQAFVRMLIGGRGAGKTASVAVEAIRHCWDNAGAKVIFARKTETSQVGSTIDTLMWCFNQMGPWYSPAGHGLFRSWNDGLTFRIPSRLALEKLREASETRTGQDLRTWVEQEGKRYCGEIQMKGLPHVSAGDSKLRGMECSMMVFIEGDQIERRAFDLSFACLRWKGADRTMCDRLGFIRDRSIILDTNPPSESHWIAQLEKTEWEKPERDRRMEYWHLRTDENAHNLPPNYIRDTIMLPYEGNPAMIERMRFGRYADAFDGKPVYYAYQRGRHEYDGERDPVTMRPKRMPWPNGATLICSMDVGTNNASIVSAYKASQGHLHWWTMREVIQTESDTDRQCLEVLQVLANEFPFWNTGTAVCPQTLFYCDPAARNSAFTKAGPTSSALKVMHSHGIMPGMKLSAHLQPTFAAVNRLLQQKHEIKTPTGTAPVWHFRIDVNRCPTLARGLRGAYRYPTKLEPGYGSDQPLKGSLCDHVDHPMDALRYGIINVLDIATEDHQGGQRSNQPETGNPEPNRAI